MTTTTEMSPHSKTLSKKRPGSAKARLPGAAAKAKSGSRLNQKLINLAEKIRQSSQGTIRLEDAAVRKMCSTGDLLNDAKRMCEKHGNWLPFLADHGISVRSAQECMWIAKNWSKIEAAANTNGRSYLTLTEARQVVRSQSPKALEYNSKQPGSHATVKAKKKPEPPTKQPEPQTDGRAQVEMQESPELAPAPPEPAAKPKYQQGAGATLDKDADHVETWLTSLPLRAQLENAATFDAAARLWHLLQPSLDVQRRIVVPEEFELGRAALPGMARNKLRLRVMFTAYITPPELWPLCPSCRGRLTDRPGKIPCPRCEGSGFLIAHEGDARAETLDETPTP